MTLFRDGPVCYQASVLEGALNDDTEQSEDCLTLNIFTNRWVLHSSGQGDSGHCTLYSVGWMLRSRLP